MFNKKPDAVPSSNNVAAANQPESKPIDLGIQIDTKAEAAKTSNSIIDEWLTMTGDLESEGDILVKGKILGNVSCKMLIIDEKASIEGEMTAQQVVVRGSSKGTIRANRVLLERTARVASEIYHNSFAAEEGARIEGVLHHSAEPQANKCDSSKPAPQKVSLAAVTELAAS